MDGKNNSFNKFDLEDLKSKEVIKKIDDINFKNLFYLKNFKKLSEKLSEIKKTEILGKLKNNETKEKIKKILTENTEDIINQKKLIENKDLKIKKEEIEDIINQKFSLIYNILELAFPDKAFKEYEIVKNYKDIERILSCLFFKVVKVKEKEKVKYELNIILKKKILKELFEIINNSFNLSINQNKTESCYKELYKLKIEEIEAIINLIEEAIKNLNEKEVKNDK